MNETVTPILTALDAAVGDAIEKAYVALHNELWEIMGDGPIRFSVVRAIIRARIESEFSKLTA